MYVNDWHPDEYNADAKWHKINIQTPAVSALFLYTTEAILPIFPQHSMMHRWAHTSAHMVAKKTVTSYSIATIYEYWLEGHERHVFIFVQYIYHNKLHRVIHAGMNPPSNLATGGQAGSGTKNWEEFSHMAADTV